MTEYRAIDSDGVLSMAKERRALGDRLVQMHCSHGEEWELIYSFDGSEGFVHFKVVSKESLNLKSISDFFPGAYLYENEICELFGIHIEGMSVDFKGMLYNPQRSAPFNLAACETCSSGVAPTAAASGSASAAGPTGADLSSGLGAKAPPANRTSPGIKAMAEEVASLAPVAAAAELAAAKKAAPQGADTLSETKKEGGDV